MDEVVQMPGLEKYLVTRVETVTVLARTEAQALFNGKEKLDFVGAETTNLQAEVLEG